MHEIATTNLRLNFQMCEWIKLNFSIVFRTIDLIRSRLNSESIRIIGSQNFNLMATFCLVLFESLKSTSITKITSTYRTHFIGIRFFLYAPIVIINLFGANVENKNNTKTI